MSDDTKQIKIMTVADYPVLRQGIACPIADEPDMTLWTCRLRISPSAKKSQPRNGSAILVRAAVAMAAPTKLL
jgi:hypothetical protein